MFSPRRGTIARRRAMTGIAALVALTAVALVAGIVLARRRRRDGVQRPLALASPGGRAFAEHVGTLSDLRMDLQLPRSRR
jgi:hypothetical protein